jgi:thiol-disulfide isomerase/thioredoxin
VSGKRKRNSVFFTVAIVATVLLAACGGAIPQSPNSDPADSGPADSELPARLAGDTAQAADFSISVYAGQEILGGQEIQFSDLLSQDKPVVLNLWAGLCPPCRLEMPEFQRVSDRFGDDILLFGLDVGPFTNLGTSEQGQALVQELGITYPTGTTSNADLVQDYQILGMPTTYFVTPDGEIVRTWTGLLTEDKLAELVEELIDVSAGS